VLAGQSRERLRDVDTIIVDEIHALAPTKRGNPSRAVARALCALTARDPQRIGLSATQRPLIEVARYLGGDRAVEIIDASTRPALDLQIVMPSEELAQPGNQEGGGMWPLIYPRLLDMILAHRSTIVFVNSRRLAERVAQQLTELAVELGSRAGRRGSSCARTTARSPGISARRSRRPSRRGSYARSARRRHSSSASTWARSIS